MGSISWVAGTTGLQGGGTSMSLALPSGIQDGDGVFAWWMTRSTPTAPAGWTQVDSVACVGSGATNTLRLYRKDTVVAANSGTSHTWQQSTNDAMGLTYFVVRAASGVVVVRETTKSNTDNATVGSIALPSNLATRSTEVLVSAGSTVLTGGTFNPTAPVGMTKFTATSTTNYRMPAAYAQTAEQDAISGTWTLYTTSANNGVGVMLVRLSDQEEQTTITDTVDFEQADDESGSTYGVVLSEIAGLHNILGDLFEDTLSDTPGFADAPAAILPQLAALADTLQTWVSDLTATRAQSATASETLGLALTQVATPGVILRQGLGIAESVGPALKFGQILTDIAQVVDQLRVGVPVALADTLGLARAVTAARAAQVIDSLGLAPALTPVVQYQLTVSQGIGLHDVLARFFAGDIAETVGIAQSEAATYRAIASLSAGIGLADAVTPRLVLRAVASDGVGIADEDMLKLLFAPEITEGIEITAGYVAPDGSFTTWAVNARTGAVTEYDNYVFNSFARLGNKYLGASSSGLCELLGDDDDGVDIAARIKSGYMQFGGTHLSRLKEAYIAATGEGTMVLKIITKDGDQYTYQADTRDGRSTKVHMGKGQRARYFAFELTTTDGHDFDLDTLEFVPIVMQRRV